MTTATPGTRPQQQGAFCPRSVRRVACIFPRYAPSFGTFQHAYPLLPGVRAFMPPQGLLLIAAYLPPTWPVRFIDENLRPATDRDLAWADAVFISGMHVQRRQIESINARAHRHGKLTVLGGPSVSSAPEYYPDVDILHLGELGDATDELLQRLDESTARPAQQVVLQTRQRLPLERFPTPAYHLVDMRRYLLGSIQFSSGCPFLCEFCDIPALYGRNPRLKAPEQILAELDAIVAAGARGAVYFVDDNFIANRQATRRLLPHLVRWQQQRGYPLRFACEATLDLAQCPDILQLMREARFQTVFCGIETPEPEALSAMHKRQNLRQPILEAVRTLNRHGMEVVSGIILGLDTDTPRTADHLLRFIEESGIPMLTINLLYALPKTRLYERLQAEGRLIGRPDDESNVLFKMPQEQVKGMWRRCIAQAYEPEALFERFARQIRQTYPHRLGPKGQRVRLRDLAYALRVLTRIAWRVGVRADYRGPFWRTVRPLLRQGRLEELIHIGLVSHHLIRFTRASLAGQAEACFYADPGRAQPRAAGAAPVVPLTITPSSG